MVRVVNVSILLNGKLVIVFKHDNSTFIAVSTAIIGCTEHSHYWGEGLTSSPLVHLVTINLDLMGTDNG
jgi:hypothetical protein